MLTFKSPDKEMKNDQRHALHHRRMDGTTSRHNPRTTSMSLVTLETAMLVVRPTLAAPFLS